MHDAVYERADESAGVLRPFDESVFEPPQLREAQDGLFEVPAVFFDQFAGNYYHALCFVAAEVLPAVIQEGRQFAGVRFRRALHDVRFVKNDAGLGGV